MIGSHLYNSPSKVTQADCDAAADLIEAYWPHDEQMQKLAKSYRCGHSQGIWVQAFARHRAAAMEQAAVIKQAGIELALKAGILNVALDGQTKYAAKRQSVLEAMQNFNTAIRQAIGADNGR